MIIESNLPVLFRPGQYAILEDYHIAPVWWDGVYTKHTARFGVEYETQMASLGPADIKQNAGPITLRSMQQAYTTRYVMQYYGIGFTMSRNVIKDNLYHREFPQATLSLKNSLQYTKNVNAAFVFNVAFNPLFPLADGQPLGSLVHPTVAGPQLANTFNTVTDLSESALEIAYTTIRSTWTNLAGLKLDIQAVKLLTGPALGFTSSRILNGFNQTNTPNLNINALYHDGYIPGGYMTTQFINDPTYWFLKTDEPNTMKYFLSEPLEVDYTQDTITQNLTTVAFERYAFGCPNWRIFWCGPGAP